MKSMASDSINKRIIENLGEFVKRMFIAQTGEPIKLTSYQEEFIKKVLKREKKKYIFLACTRAGKSEATAILAILLAIMYDGEEIVVIAPTFRQSQILFGRIRNHIVSNDILYSLIDKKRGFRRDEINFVNGSKVICLSAGNPEGLLGFGATVLIVDEAGSIPDEVFRTRILRMIASKHKHEPVVILLGTPHADNYFKNAWFDPEFEKVKVTWREAVKEGRIREEEIEFIRSRIPEREFRIWYEAEFMGSEDVLVDDKDIEDVMVLSRMKEAEEGYEYYAGLDIARFGSDESAYVVVRIPKGVSFDDATIEMVAMYTRGKRPLSDIIGWAREMTLRWNVKALGVDSIGMGAGVFDVLKEKLPNVYEVTAAGRERNEIYFLLKSLIENKKIRLIKDEKLKYQFKSFKITYTSDGRVRILKDARIHDDLVDALAIACYVLSKFRREDVHVFDRFSEYENLISRGLLG